MGGLARTIGRKLREAAEMKANVTEMEDKANNQADAEGVINNMSEVIVS